MSYSSNAEPTVERKTYFREADSGVRVVFFTMVLKIASIEGSYPGGVRSFFGEQPYPWEIDGKLCSTASMTDDLDDLIGLLGRHDMQCKEHPVDYYLVDAEFGIDDGLSYPIILSKDDGGIDFYADRDKKFYARLKWEGLS